MQELLISVVGYRYNVTYDRIKLAGTVQNRGRERKMNLQRRRENSDWKWSLLYFVLCRFIVCMQVLSKSVFISFSYSNHSAVHFAFGYTLWRVLYSSCGHLIGHSACATEWVALHSCTMLRVSRSVWHCLRSRHRTNHTRVDSPWVLASYWSLLEFCPSSST